jgi:mRNA-degrading endonuclease RelE of RelBE toxin-antitoxin system
MKIVKTEDFEIVFKKLPKDIQKIFFKQESYFLNNPRDPRLHIKKVLSLRYAFSFRVTGNYRVFFYFQNSETAVFFDMDHRKDIYRKLK